MFDVLKKYIGQLVSFDRIATELWQESEEKYSEYAITKLIERLKKKLPKYSIHSQRGVGYILVK
ncbi:helix-turn-helix domain-containing protein [Candidatus Shapirobacteria bacterium]|nr:helix-turn-helix domain-containing protein [Candidatus Shapirobacteria bacterium]